MKLEVGKKYTDGRDIVEVKFFDYEGTAWCLSNRNYCKYIHKNESNWREVVDKPDPGEGWRLLDPCEDVEAGDEYFSVGASKWLMANNHRSYEGKQTANVNYRRRIAPQYVPFTWEDREQLRGRWYTMTLSCGEIRECQIEFLRLDRNVFIIGSFPSDQLLEKNARFLDTGEPVGKRVQ